MMTGALNTTCEDIEYLSDKHGSIWMGSLIIRTGKEMHIVI